MPTYFSLSVTPQVAAVSDFGSDFNADFVRPAGLNDFYLDSSGNLATVTDAEAVGQHAKQRLKTFKGEWFLDRRVGVDWFGRVFGGSESNVAVAEAMIKATILATPGVTGIVELETEFDRQTRGVRAKRCYVETAFSDAPILI